MLLYGARQVGKTWLLKEFGKNNFEQFVYIDLEKNSIAREAFAQQLEPAAILPKLERIVGQKIEVGKTLLILDEIQASNRALASLKYFNEDMAQLAVIAAGSLLGVAVNREGYSAPVGNVDALTLYPMSFDEFLNACGYSELVAETQESFATMQATPFHQQLLDIYADYLLVGGMPEAVASYADNKNYDDYLHIQNMINDLYIADMAKYALPYETAKIRDVWISVPAQLAKTNHKFQYKIIKSGARASQYSCALAWLVTAGLINACQRVHDAAAPLSLNAEPDAFKIYLGDTGLLSARVGMTPQMTVAQAGQLNSLQGAFTENYVMQALVASGKTPYYWESSGVAQLDFLLQEATGDIIPVEVKSSTNTRSKSLGVFTEKYKPPYSVRISPKNFGFEGGIKSVPLYAAFCL
jgi:predicted AAA+ superfamily ATPase